MIDAFHSIITANERAPDKSRQTSLSREETTDAHPLLHVAGWHVRINAATMTVANADPIMLTRFEWASPGRSSNSRSSWTAAKPVAHPTIIESIDGTFAKSRFTRSKAVAIGCRTEATTRTATANFA